MTYSMGLRGFAGVFGVGVVLAVGGVAQAAAPADAKAQEAWGRAIEAVPVPGEGCFRASYPDLAWRKVGCTVAPARPYVPRGGRAGRTVGNGNDYAAVTANLTQSASGSFPAVTGVTRETGYGGVANDYSLQLNSNFMSTAACDGSSDPANCATWEQFVYASGETAAFMQYWLINYGSKCPAGGGWNEFQGSCYKNSAAVNVPEIAITALKNLSLHAKAVAGGSDTLVLMNGTEAYSTSGRDSVVDLAAAWTDSEFNVIGDGGGSQAKFNKGSSVTVEITVVDGSTAKPSCVANDGTTGETNNLKLGKCSTAGGKTPLVKFTETN